MIRETFGPSPQGSSENSGQVPSSWKMFQASLGITLTPSGQTYEEWVTGLRRVYSRRLRRAQAIGGSGSTSWPTPEASEASGIMNDSMQFRTLASGRLRKMSNSGVEGSIGLARTAMMWLSPKARDERPPTEAETKRHSPDLPTTAATWRTPRRTEANRWMHRRENLTLFGQASMFQAPTIEMDGEGSFLVNGVMTGLVLNPQFDERLMGWPKGWTDINNRISETDFQQWVTESYRLLRHLLGGR